MNQPVPGGGAVLLDFRDTAEWKAEQERMGRERLEREARDMARAEYEKTDAYRLEQEEAEQERMGRRRARFMAYILVEVPDAANISTDIDAMMAVYECGYYDGSMSHHCPWDS